MKIPILRLNYSDREINQIKKEIVEVLKSNYLTMGKKVESFEKKFADYVGAKYAVATNSGTSSLEIILRAIGCEGKSVIVPTITFMATAIAVIHAGAKVIFTDVTKEDLSIDPEDLKKKIRRDTRAVILVHIGGIISSNFYKIKRICEERKIFLLEDAAHAFGASIDEKMAGTLGIAGSFSFYPTKIITTAEGGMITTNNREIYRKARILREHGKKNPNYNIHTEFGYNWRFSELHAILGLQQMRKAKKIIKERQEIARYYDEKLKDVKGLEPIKIPPNIKSPFHKYILYLEKGIEPAKVKKAMLEKYDICLPGEVYREPCHSQPVFKKYPKWILNKSNDTFPSARYVCSRQVCLPLYPGLKKKELEYIVKSFKKAIRDIKK
jgi:dTDP-4-amino-4,6-dideoxygalactose transaminase